MDGRKIKPNCEWSERQQLNLELRYYAARTWRVCCDYVRALLAGHR